MLIKVQRHQGAGDFNFNMVIVDTSVWIEHFKEKNESLISLIEDDEILIHPFVIAELACGHLKNREETIGLLLKLPAPELLSIEEILIFVSKEKLYSRGVGFVDVSLLGSSILSNALLWTYDKSLNKVSTSFDISFQE